MKEVSLILFLFSIGAFFVPFLSRYLFIPASVGEVLYGILLGVLLKEHPKIPIIEFLAHFGFIFLMFLAGLELKFYRFSWKDSFKSLLLVGIVYGVGFLGFSLKGVYLFLLGAFSVGLMYVLLREFHLVDTLWGQKGVLIGSLGEFVSIVGMVFLEFSLAGEKGEGIGKNLLGLVILFISAYFLFRVLFLLFWWFPHVLSNLLEEKSLIEITVRFSFFVLLSMMGIAAYFHLELILGAFLGGLVLSSLFKGKHVLEEKLSSIGHGFFIPFFFIHVGWDFSRAFPYVEEILSILWVYLEAFLVMRIFLWIFLPFLFSEFNIKRSFVVFLLLSCPFTLLVAIAQMGFSLGVLSYKEYYAGVLLALITGGIFPIFLRGFLWILSPKRL